MSPTETDIFFDRGVLKKADALQMFWLFAVSAVAVSAVAVLAVAGLLLHLLHLLCSAVAVAGPSAALLLYLT